MNAFSHATSRLFPINLRLQYIFGLQGRPSIILIGAPKPDSDGLSSVRFSVTISDNLAVLISNFSFPTVRFSSF